MRLEKDDAKIGLLVFLTLALFVGFIFQRSLATIFRKESHLQVRLESASDVAVGTEVQLQGLRVGQVERVRLQRDRVQYHFLADLGLRTDIVLWEGTHVLVVAKPLGGSYLDLQLPPPGAAVTISFLLDQEVVVIRTVLLEPLAPEAGGRQQQRVVRAAWPTLPLEWHHRDEVRVATPDLPPLRATLSAQGQRIAAELLNLTETGIGLGLKRVPPFPLLGEMEVDTLLPGGVPLHLVGDVRHSGRLDGDPLPVRLGLVLRALPVEIRETLRRMIQARRVILSEAIREE